jgi:hypothetical protein
MNVLEQETLLSAIDWRFSSGNRGLNNSNEFQ